MPILNRGAIPAPDMPILKRGVIPVKGKGEMETCWVNEGGASTWLLLDPPLPTSAPRHANPTGPPRDKQPPAFPHARSSNNLKALTGPPRAGYARLGDDGPAAGPPRSPLGLGFRVRPTLPTLALTGAVRGTGRGRGGEADGDAPGVRGVSAGR
ncbi:hypothetical protein T484DRAFT_1763537 [Baffinella frigidus]|nr:hypothetical protein T484DRAFT_1763537 [Cryptophyta sp. CCMP2293]